ncbi:hypothetical protein ACWGLF_34260 [Streptomyces puniciscabiei]
MRHAGRSGIEVADASETVGRVVVEEGATVTDSRIAGTASSVAGWAGSTPRRSAGMSG